MDKVLIQNGHVEIKDSVCRKVAKKYYKVLFEGVASSVGGDAQIPLCNIDEASEILVLEMTEKAVINEKEIEVNQDFIDNLDALDYAKISNFCSKKINQKEVQKKS